MVSIRKSKIRKYKSKKCNSRLKNKIAKYSRKLLIGGAKTNPLQKLSFTIPIRNHTTNPNTNSHKSSLTMKEKNLQNYAPLSFKIPIRNHTTKNNIIYNNPSLTKEEGILREYYKKESMNVDRNFEFKKYKCFYKEDAKYVDHISYLYEKISGVNNETYRVYAPTNQSISIEYKVVSTNEPKYKEIGKLFDITPLELSVDIMQLAINTGKISISSDTQGNSYLGFIDFPSLVIKDKPAGTSFSFTSRTYANWISVYEEQFEEPDKKFDLIKTHDERHIDKNTLEKEIKILEEKIRILEEMKTIRTNIDPIKIEKSKDELTKLKGDLVNIALVNKITNEELFVMKQAEMRKLLEGTKPFDEKDKTKIEEQVKYRAYVRIEDDKEDEYTDVFSNTSTNEPLNKPTTNEPTTNEPTTNEPSTTTKPHIISEDISWVMQNALWLEKYLELGGKSIKNLEKHYMLNSTKYECDLSGLSQQYIIVDEFVNNGEGGDNESYVICGYPDKKMKAIILNFWQNETMKAELDKVHQEQRKNLGNLLVDFYNSNKEYKDVFPTDVLPSDVLPSDVLPSDVLLSDVLPSDILPPDVLPPDVLPPDVLPQDVLLHKNKKDYFKLYYKVRQQDWIYLINYFNNKFINTKDDKYKDFENTFKNLFAEYYNKIADIYLNKLNINIKYVFLIFKKEKDKLIPAIFNFKELDLKNKIILERINVIIKKNISKIFNIITETEYLSDNTDINEYKLYYSYYKYGTFFHIKTEYLHTMSNIFNFPHHYINTITLEELSYSCSYNEFNKNLKINYLIREYLITQKKIKNNKNIVKNRADDVFKQYNDLKIQKIEEKKEEKDNKEILKNIHTFLISVIVLVFKFNRNEYLFIYKYENKFYKIAFKSYMSNNLDLIITKINSIKSNIITFQKQEQNKLFEILLCKELTHEDYKNIFKYNPINLKNIKINKNLSECNLKEYYLSELLKNNQPNVLVDNLFNQSIKYPILIDNYLNRSDIYINHIKILKFNPILKGDKCNIEICNNNEILINNVYYDDNTLGYNIIETFYDNRIIIWILPSNLNTSKQTHKYLGNVFDLDYTSLPILYKIQSLYENKNNTCFFHMALSVQFYCLHIHIIPRQYLYERKYPEINMGTIIIQEIYLNNLINNIEINNNYYKNINYNIIKQ